MTISRRQRILVVDEEPVFCAAICRELALDYHFVAFVDSGNAALEVLQENNFDVLITDFALPGMRGYKLAAAAKALRPNLLIALIAANAESLKATPFVDTGYVNSKPFEVKELRQTVARLLRTRTVLALTE